ncbi:NTP transferase domain-containing protein, partial [Chroococcidiopsis sp.]|uniref:NTP transferase domain-containing protein n=1 Tax=Chroococcidiopsis sp. TaxID=3088168 RepID=UPI003F40EDDF
MVAVAILAAGRGTRMKSTLPKVLHQIGGRSLIERAILGSLEISPKRVLVIVGYQAEQVKTALLDPNRSLVSDSLPKLEFVEQTEQLGTGHAIQQVLPHLEGFQGDLLVLNGDVPLLRPQTLERLIQTHKQHQHAATILTAQLSDPQGYGRVFCNGQNIVQQIIEDRDCSAAQKQNRRVNAGVYCFRWQDLANVLP